MTTAVDILIRARDQASATMGKVGAAGSAMGSKLNAASAKMTSVGRTATTHLTLPLLGLAAAAVHTEAEFSKTMNLLQASTGATGAEMHKLSGLAMKMGADTVFSANEAAQAMFELAKGGVTQAQIAAGGLKATLTLAAAGQIELADAATYVANALSMFSLKAEDAGQVGAALAGGANASTASVESLGLALSQVGPGAKRFGLSIQETVGVLASFEQAGVKGSDAGTSFKTFLQRLIPTTLKAKEAMKDLGFEFFDAKGNFVGIQDVAQQPQDKLGGLSQQERETAINILFGSDASRAAGILMAQGARGVDKWTQATSNQNAAQKLANAGMKGTAGALERMKGSIETAGLATGKILAPMVQRLAGYVERAANWVSGLNKEQREWIVKIGALVAAFGPLLYIMGKAIKVGQGIGHAIGSIGKLAGGSYKAVKGLQGALKFSNLEMIAWGAALALAATAAYKLWKYLKIDDDKTKEWTDDIVFGKNSLQEYTDATNGMRGEQSHLMRILDGSQTVLDTYGKTVDAVTAAYMGFAAENGATMDTQLAFQSVMTRAEGITRKEGRAIVHLMNAFHNIREPINAVTLGQVANLLATGDAEGALRLLTRAYKQAIGPLTNAKDTMGGVAEAEQEAAEKGRINAAAIREQNRAANAGVPKIRNFGSRLSELAGIAAEVAAKIAINAAAIRDLNAAASGSKHKGGGGPGVGDTSGQPRLASGGFVSRTGLAIVHRGEEYLGVGSGRRKAAGSPQKVVVRLDRRRFLDELAWDATFGNDF